MTVDELFTRLRALGLVCASETVGRVTRIAVAKLEATPGNHIDGHRTPWTFDLAHDAYRTPWTFEQACREAPLVDGPMPFIRIEGGHVTFTHNSGIVPGPPNPYTRSLTSLAELYDEIIHLFFDPDSPMASDPGFVPGPGRPPNA